MSSKRTNRTTPGDFMKQLLGRQVEVKLNDNDLYRGTLCCLDGTMNVLLLGAKEIRDEVVTHEWKELLIRGNNVLYIKKNY
jgi:small nuclear ribonucleoprotein (snRNP)-like protein